MKVKLHCQVWQRRGEWAGATGSWRLKCARRIGDPRTTQCPKLQFRLWVLRAQYPGFRVGEYGYGYSTQDPKLSKDQDSILLVGYLGD